MKIKSVKCAVSSIQNQKERKWKRRFCFVPTKPSLFDFLDTERELTIHCNFIVLRILSSSMSVEQFSEFDWNKESTLVTV